MAVAQHLGNISVMDQPCCGINKELECLYWYHGDISRHVSEGLLLGNGIDGSYLLRNSSAPGEYALSVRCKETVKHFKIQWDGIKYTFGMGTFDNISDFEQHFRNKPLIGGESGVLTVLRHPYPKNVHEPGIYDSVRLHATMGPDVVPSGSPNFAINAKEGWLTKLGGNIKNWKTRWFVMRKNELMYFRDRTDKSPIRTIDLNEARQCEIDNSKGREYCFRLVLPWRTFYMCASSRDEAQDWIKALQWRLKNPRGA